MAYFYFKDLPLKHLLTKIAGRTKGPRKREGDLGKDITNICNNLGEMIDFDPIKVKNDLMDSMTSASPLIDNNDQKTFWTLWQGVKNGRKYLLDKYGTNSPVGPSTTNAVRWLMNGTAILRLYIETPKEKNYYEELRNLTIITMRFYGIMFFEIKRYPEFHMGPIHFHKMVKLARESMDEDDFKFACKYFQINGFWAHPENILVAMLKDPKFSIRSKAVDIILKARTKEKDEETFRRFIVPPKINFLAEKYYELVDMNLRSNHYFPPILRKFSDDEIRVCAAENSNFDLPINGIPNHQTSNEKLVQDVYKTSQQVTDDKVHQRVINLGESREKFHYRSKKTDYLK